jgi:pyruvate/2-oxoglutarate dehydrogenase complex dihydrolipoamide dehydrogenase (E3) component/uncharacterized membrane protein YdjX (TVP38/TMEM64 family)
MSARPGRSAAGLRLFAAALLGAAAAAFFILDLGDYLTLAAIKAEQARLEAYIEARPLYAALAYFLLYVLITGVSLPGAAILTLAGGALFGLLWGTVLVSFASTLGATAAFLLARFILRDVVQRRYGERLARVNRGIDADGAFYLFTLRLVPLFPFFLINLLMGLTPLRVITFFVVSQVGMLPGTLVYVNAGTQLARVESAAGILSPALIASFTLLGLFPLIARSVVRRMQGRRILRRHARPRRFDRNLVVIGAGSAGLVSAYVAAAVRAKVTLIEKHRMGGDCLNTGCVPSKALIRSARFIAECRRSARYGVRRATVEFDFAEIMERVRAVIAAIAPHDSIERYTALGVECLQGEARITSPWEVEVEGRRLTTRAIVVAAGGRPAIPPVPGIDEVPCYTSDTIWSLAALPQRLVVLGGGPIGCELAQCFARFGSRVTVVEMEPRLLPREEPEASALIEEAFRADGIDLLLGERVLRFERHGAGGRMFTSGAGDAAPVAFDALLAAAGRRANTEGYGLEALGVGLTPQRTIEVDDFLQTRCPTIFACGDVAGPYQFTHMAAHQAWYAAVNALFGYLKRFRVDYSTVPWAIFTDPEIARVGSSEAEARLRGIDCEVTTYDLAELDRAVADGAARGFVKVVTRRGADRVIGATIAGEHAAELINELVGAMRHRIGLNRILGTIHIYPTWSEANRYVAGAWKRAHAPAAALALLERMHRWRR